MKEIQKFVCLLGLPRSGTTLAATILDAHPAVEMFYEPWNSYNSKLLMKRIEKFSCLLGLPRSGTTLARTILDAHPAFKMFYAHRRFLKKGPPPIYENPLVFKKQMKKKFRSRSKPDSSVVGFKETSLHQEALEWSKLTLMAMARHCECLLLIIVREPIHAYLSKVEGAKKYWNNAGAELTEEGYEEFIRQAINAYRFMDELSKIYRTMVFDYDALVLSPEYVFPRIMELMGLHYSDSQLYYFGKGFQSRKIMGDPGFVAKSQKGIGISKESITKRQEEAKEFKNCLKSSFWQEPAILALDEFVQRVHNEKVLSGREIRIEA
ncbi:MAG: sulfotransferase [Desulfobacterales bacterium]|jgi:hypothetical protein|nr:sulfotransferase [Desulfobacterales bacterium]